MKRIMLQILNIIFQLFKSLLLALFSISIISLFLDKNKYLQNILLTTNRDLLIGITSLICFFLIVSWNKFSNFCKKYKNTHRASISKFTSVDSLFSIILFLIIIAILKITPVKTSLEIRIFLLLNGILTLIYLLSAFYKRDPLKDNPLQYKTNNDINDEPIYFSEEDLLNRDIFVNGLYQEINHLNATESFVYGLYGKWGEGKSSVLNLLRQKFFANDKFIIMNFDPWIFKDEEAIIKAFFSTLDQSLNKEYILPDLKKTIYNYQKLISSGLAHIGFKIDFSVEETNIDELKQKIENHIKNTGKKLLIIIDDIDRLQSDEIKIIFKLIRSNSKFNHSVFLLSLDYSRTIEKLNPHGSDFLEKIIQKPISLPKIEQSFIDNYLLFSKHKIPDYIINEMLKLKPGTFASTSGYITKIEKNVIEITDSLESKEKDTILIHLESNAGSVIKIGSKIFVEGIVENNTITLNDPISKLIPFQLSRLDHLLESMLREEKINIEQIIHFDKEFVFLYKNHISNIIENFRDAKLFLNSLSSSYPAIADEVCPFDFICLEIIKVFAKDIYEDIFQNWWYYVDQRSEGDNSNNPFFFTLSGEKKEKIEETTGHLNEVFKNINLEPRHETTIRNILKNLFPNLSGSNLISEQDRKDKRIFTSSFIKYFTLSTPSTELPDVFFQKELKKWKNDQNITTIQHSIDVIQERGKLKEFFDKLRRIFIKSLSEKVTDLLLSCISLNINRFSKNNEGYFRDSEYENALILVLKILNSKIDDKVKIDLKIKEIINNTPDFLFAVDLVLTTKKDRGGDLFSIYDNVNHIELRKILSQRLEKHYIDGSKDIIKENPYGWGRILFQWSSNWSDEESPNKRKVSNYLVNLFKKNPNYLVELVKTFNRNFPNEEWGMNYKEYDQVYELRTFAIFAEKIKAKNEFNYDDSIILNRFINVVNSQNK